MFKRWLNTNPRSFLLLGPRRAGKSTYLKQNFSDYKYITLDDLDVLDQAQKDPKSIVELGEKLIIDEIQREPKLTIAVKFGIDEQQKTILMSGSSRIGLLDASADSLAGRIDILHLPPCCWGEEEGDPTHDIFDEQSEFTQLRKANRLLERTLQYGGFPEVVTKESDNEKKEILKNYQNTYFTRDLSQLSNIEDITGLSHIIYQFASSIGSLTSTSTFQKDSGLSYPTAQKYMNVIFQSDLAFTLLGYQYGKSKQYIKSKKSYFCDNGMITAIEARCTDGQIFENFVISEIEKRRKIGQIPAAQLYYYQTKGGAEIDLILETDDDMKAIEIKATENPQPKDVSTVRDFVDFQRIKSEKKVQGFLVYKGLEYKSIQNVKCIPVAAFYRGRC